MSSKRIIGSAEVLGNLAINGKYTMRTFNGTAPNANTGIVSYPYYKRQEVQDILDMLPISRIGEMDYLPLNISGSFRGATSYANVSRVQPTIIEDDGTAVIIRAGTNGSTSDFYYSYIRNIRNIPTLTQEDVVQTNTPYAPSYFTPTQKIVEFYGTNGYDLLWYKTTDAGVDRYTITVTNGSFNEVGHQSTQFLVSQFPNFRPNYAHIVAGLVYMWGWDSTLSNNGKALLLYTIPVSSIRAGNTNGFVQVTGFNGSTVLYQPYSNSPNARLYDEYASSNPAVNSLFQFSGDMWTVETYDFDWTNVLAAGNANGTQIRLAYFPTYRFAGPLSYTGVMMLCISLVYDISTKTFTYDTTSLGKATVTGTNNSSNTETIYTENNPYKVLGTNWRGYEGYLGNCGTICQANDGFTISTRSRWTSDSSYGIAKFKINSFTSQFDSIKMNNRSTNSLSQLAAYPTYGSAVGEDMTGLRLISKERVIVAAAGTYEGVTNADYDNLVVSDIGADVNFQYQSIYNGTLSGYAPQTYRKFAPNTNFKLSGLISLVDAVGNVTAHGSSFYEKLPNKVGGFNLNPDTLEFDGGTCTIDPAVMQTLKQSAAAAAGLSLQVSEAAVYYVPDSSYCNSMVVVMNLNTSTNVGTVVYAEANLTVNTSGSNTAITGGSIIKTHTTTRTDISGIYTNNMARFTGITAAKYSGFNYVGVVAGSYFRVPGDNRSNTMIAKFKGSSIESARFENAYYLSTAEYMPGVLPNVGFGLYIGSMNYTDAQTKLTFSLYGTSEAQLDGLIDKTGPIINRRVVLSQEVPEGFTVYFTQELPVFIGGLYDKLAVQTIDLKTIKADPSNSTFYIYVNMDRTTRKAAYVISESLYPESLTQTYIGTIITGAVGIDSVDTEKVTRFLTYRPSTVKRGSAIPTSTGVPSGPGSRWH